MAYRLEWSAQTDRGLVPNITGSLAITIPIAMSVGSATGLNPVVCGLLMMIAGDAAPYYPAQSASSLVVYERGHLSGPEIFRFGLWMTLVANLVVLDVALPYWAAVGEPLVTRAGEPAGGLRGDSRVDKVVKVCISQVSSGVVASCDRQKAWQVFGTLVQ